MRRAGRVAHGRGQEYVQSSGKILMGREYVGDIDVDVRIILKWIFKELNAGCRLDALSIG
jgi:hypothetical protein